MFNIRTGRVLSVLEVISAFEAVSNKKLNYKIINRRVGDVIATYADTTKANNALAWEAELDLKDALSSAWKWEQRIKIDLC